MGQSTKQMVKVQLTRIAGVGWDDGYIGGLRSNKIGDSEAVGVGTRLADAHIKARWDHQLGGGWRAFVKTSDAKAALGY
jgi:hypothetical protein